MSLFSQSNTILVTCGRGIVPFLHRELRSLGFPVVLEHSFGIETEGTLEDTMLLNLALRTAQRVLYRIQEARVSDPRGLYRVMNRFPWETVIDPEDYLSITSVVQTPSIRDSRFATRTAKDAIVDRLAAHTGRRPDSGPGRTGVVIHCYWKHDRLIVYIDTSGESLSRRGYRLESVQAPLQESLAAALIMAASWSGSGTAHFINPMCGSGTFAIEAALMALGKAPGLTRRHFGFMHIKGYRSLHWRKLRNTFNRRTGSRTGIRIIATDIDAGAVAAARINADAAGVGSCIEFECCPFEETVLPDGAGLIMLNPEYGKRLGREPELASVYRRIGDWLKRRCAGSRAAVFTGNPELTKNVGLRAHKRMTFYNGAIECRLLCYDLYEGSARTRERARHERGRIPKTPEAGRHGKTQ